MSAQEATQTDRDRRRNIQESIQENIASLLNTEIQQLEHLREILDEETKVLGGHDPEQMEQTARYKADAVASLEACSQQRIAYVRQLNINPLSEAWFDKLIPHLYDWQTLAETFDYLVSLTNRCRSLNQSNGLLINRRESMTSKVINILRANNTPEIYSGSGQSEGSSDTRILGKA